MADSFDEIQWSGELKPVPVCDCVKYAARHYHFQWGDRLVGETMLPWERPDPFNPHTYSD